MSREPELAFEHVWKKFRRGQAHDSLRDLLPAIARRLTGRGARSLEEPRDFWAVRDFSFRVTPGEVLGIIGPNGAGKSTTLKLLNRVMEPTAGVVRTQGKVGSLIEVSAGFHQDLTGRQNIFLQGAIMGMRKAEVQKKFDEIVDFSGVGEFLDTPVKRYSNGMNARLGFSIAAHLEPDILIIDEVLAVGDASFQQKAFARIKAMATGGAPVVLVSHQLDRIRELCTKAILLEKGEVRASGTPAYCVDEYLYGSRTKAAEGAGSDAGIWFQRVHAPNGTSVFSGQELTIVVEGNADFDDAAPSWTPAFRIADLRTGAEIYSVTGFHRQVPLPVSGRFEYHFTVQMNVAPGPYTVQPYIWDSMTRSSPATGPILQIEVLEKMAFYGTVQLNSRWKVVEPGVGEKLADPSIRQTA